MADRSFRWLGVVVGAAALSGATTITPALPTGVKTVRADVKLADTTDTEALGMGGSGIPIPSPELLDNVAQRYLNPDPAHFAGQPVFQVDSVHPLFTPEGWYPITGTKSLPFDTSAAQGVEILDHTIKDRIAAGHDLVIGGGSQSSTISSLEMRDLLALPDTEQPTSEQLSFVLLVDPSNPNGGLLERFGDDSLPPLTVPSLGATFSGATPADTPWDTAIYNIEYDGISDFPSYPLNVLSDLNAALGTALVHASVTDVPDAQLANTAELAVSDDYAGHTQYFMIPTEDLPLLEPVRAIPVVGDPLADLLQPDLRVLVNLGYGNIDHGWDPGPADIPTPFGLFPDVDWDDVATALSTGAQQGVGDFIDDLESLSLPDMTEAAGHGTDGAADSLPSLTDIVNAFTSAAASAYATLLPEADVVNALVTAVPAYDASLFAQEITSGDLLDAIGLPIAADFGLAAMGAVIAARPILATVQDIIGDFQDLSPS